MTPQGFSDPGCFCVFKRSSLFRRKHPGGIVCKILSPPEAISKDTTGGGGFTFFAFSGSASEFAWHATRNTTVHLNKQTEHPTLGTLKEMKLEKHNRRHTRTRYIHNDTVGRLPALKLDQFPAFCHVWCPWSSCGNNTNRKVAMLRRSAVVQLIANIYLYLC